MILQDWRMILKFWKILCECGLEKNAFGKGQMSRRRDGFYSMGCPLRPHPCAWQPLNVHTTWGCFPREAWVYIDSQKIVAEDMGNHLPGPSCASALLVCSPWGPLTTSRCSPVEWLVGWGMQKRSRREAA